MTQLTNEDEAAEFPVRTRNGHLLTEEDVAALAAEAEDGYDLPAAKRVQGGAGYLRTTRNFRLGYDAA